MGWALPVQCPTRTWSGIWEVTAKGAPRAVGELINTWAKAPIPKVLLLPLLKVSSNTASLGDVETPGKGLDGLSMPLALWIKSTCP